MGNAARTEVKGMVAATGDEVLTMAVTKATGGVSRSPMKAEAGTAEVAETRTTSNRTRSAG
jgi:hypothetical protein